MVRACGANLVVGGGQRRVYTAEPWSRKRLNGNKLGLL